MDFQQDYISDRVCCIFEFLHTLQPPKLLFQLELRRWPTSDWALSHISSYGMKYAA